MPLLHPVKITGNLAGLSILTGLVMMMIARLKAKKGQRGGYSDWFFLISLFLLTASGFIVESARFLNWNLAYHLYFLHLVFVWTVIMYTPFTRFAHFLFRTMAMVISENGGKE
jgi:quinone-modifying oxidoreductase subunit QmoC